MPHWTIICRYLCACWVILPAAEAVAAEKPSPPEQNLVLIDYTGNETAGRLLKLDFNTIRLAGSPTVDQPVSHLERLQFKNSRQQIVQPTSQIFLDNGDELFAETVEITEEFLVGFWNPPQLTKASLTKQQLKIPLETVRAILFSTVKNNRAKGEAAQSQRMQQRLRSKNKTDYVLLNNGDQLAGELQELREGQFLFQVGKQERKIALSDVRGLAMNTELISFPRQPVRRWVVSLVDGSMITLTDCEWTQEQHLQVSAAWGGQFTLPLPAVVSIAFLGGRAVHLSQLTPENYQCRTFFSSTPDWKLGINRNLFGQRLNIRDYDYLLGLGMHSQGEVTFSLNKKYETFRSQIGIDNSAKGKGNVRFAIELDGKRVYTSPQVTGQMEPLSTPTLKVAHANTMQLIVEYGDRADIADHADWVNSILVRKTE